MRSNRKSSLFLMELIIALMIFAVCACVCAVISAKAADNIAKSRDMSNALIIAQNHAELIKSGKVTKSSSFFYDENLKEQAEEKNSAYSAILTLSENNEGYKEYTVEVFKSADYENPIYTINSAYFA